MFLKGPVSATVSDKGPIPSPNVPQRSGSTHNVVLRSCSLSKCSSKVLFSPQCWPKILFPPPRCCSQVLFPPQHCSQVLFTSQCSSQVLLPPHCCLHDLLLPLLASVFKTLLLFYCLAQATSDFYPWPCVTWPFLCFLFCLSSCFRLHSTRVSKSWVFPKINYTINFFCCFVFF